MQAAPDETGKADLVCDKGHIIVAEAKDLKPALKRAKKIDGYRWVAINREDLFAANPLSLGSKAGIVDAEGKVLKAADVPPRPHMSAERGQPQSGRVGAPVDLASGVDHSDCFGGVVFRSGKGLANLVAVVGGVVVTAIIIMREQSKT